MNVLYVEDNEQDALLLSRMLSHSHASAEIVCVERFKEARERLEKQTFDVILLDLSLPDAQGLETVKRMRAIATGIPIVVLTGLIDESVGVQCVQAGAQDYLVKGKIDEALLTRVIAYAIERQRVEQELITHREHLQELVQARTAELAEARDIALESARLKTEFMSNMSHEIRTPLNAVIGMTELLLDTHLTSTQRKYAKVAQSAGETLLRIINDILDFAKMESGHLMLEMEHLNVPTLLENTLELLAHQASAKGITLCIDKPSVMPDFLKGDSGRLQQVLINLVGNAVKFTKTGEVRLRAIKQAETDDTLVVEFRITDTGIGLSEEDEQKLFQPFSQADRSITRKFGGTGLGLAISKKLVELMGGQIGMESVLNQGSTFWFTIPFIKSAGEAVALPLSARLELSPLSRQDTSKKLRILVADDNEFNRILAQEQLLKLGYDVETVANGTQALHALANGPYALVLMDCRMPELDGYQTTIEIRKKEAGGAPRTPIVAMTANVLQTERQRGMASGMDDYLTKPVKIEELKNMLNQWLPFQQARPMVSTFSSIPPLFDGQTPVDLQVLQEATDGNDEAFIRLKISFFKQSSDLLERLAQAVEAKSTKEIERLAHCLAGSSVCFGANGMVLPLRQIENAAENRKLAPVNSLLKQVLTEFDRVKDFMSVINTLSVRDPLP